MMFDDGFVALGAGINCDSDNPVVTSINQCLLHGDASKSDQSVSHDGLTYVIPAPQKWQLTSGAQTGKWSDLGTGSSDALTMNVFNLSIDHGPHPKDATYSYFVFAGEDDSGDIKVLSNSPTLQAVKNTKVKLLGIALWKAGKLEAEGRTIEADQPCLLLLHDKNVSISNPRNGALTVHAKIDGKAMTVNLPGGPEAGSTVTQEMK
jgi:chondroitin AC lyase